MLKQQKQDSKLEIARALEDKAEIERNNVFNKEETERTR